MEANGADTPTEEYSASKASKFRFKSKRARTEDGEEHGREKSSRRSYDDEDRSHRHRRHHHHRHHHRSSRRKERYFEKDDPSLYDDSYDANARFPRSMDPDAAFRESLFDALADDEGAAYWEGVYGQPMHIYPNTKPGPEGELERMTDEEYAEYVRGKMWEKTHQHVLEERERRDKERKKRKAENDQAARESARLEAEREAFQEKIQESLRRGETRKAAKSWKEAWERYMKRWEELKARLDHAAESGTEVQDIIPWPIQSGKRKDISREAIEGFFRHAPSDVISLASLLKLERVKWHPDKIQQRFGERIDDETMKSVTAVFQVVDQLWNDQRSKR